MENEYGATLRRLRKARGLTLATTSKHVGVTISYMSDVERGLRLPFNAKRAAKLEDLLGADRGMLMRATEPFMAGRAEGRREMLWLMAVGAACDESLEGCSDGMSTVLGIAYGNVSTQALRALADLGDDTARRLLEEG